MTRDVTADGSNPDKTTMIGADKFMIIDSETAPNSLKEITKTNLAATATNPGVVELATDAETITGTDTARALTPANLQALTATDTRDGIIELATSAEVLTGTDAARAVTPDTLNDIVTRIPKSGYMINGKISVTVVSSDLILAIKTLAGADPSAADPVYINIGGTVRTITAATSCTLADATNWFNLGASETATLEQNLFAYAIWDSNSSVVAVAPARIPYARLVSDFSATSTNEKFIGNQANYTSTDDVCVIGRFAATLSATAAFTWTVPTFTNANLILEPIFESEWYPYVPTLTGFSANPTNTIYEYKVRMKDVFIRSRQVTNGTSSLTTFTMTAPFTARTVSNGQWQFIGAPSVDNGVAGTSPCVITIASGSATINLFKDTSLAVWTNVNGKRVGYFELSYPIAA